MNTAHYIVPTALLATNRPDSPHHASAFPADPTQSFVKVDWADSNAERAFEALDGVVFLGFPWEPLPDFAVPLIASIPQDLPSDALTVTATTAAVPAPDAPAPAPTLARALRGIAWARP